jgi:hypothetical protein
MTNLTKGLSLFGVSFVVAFVSYYIGPPVLWGSSGFCFMQKDGVSVTVSHPIDYPLIVEYGDLVAQSRKASIRFEPYGPLEYYLSDYLYSPEPTRYPFTRVLFNGHDAATATNDGMLTGGEPRTNIRIPIRPVTIYVNYDLNAMPPEELKVFLGSIKIANITSLKPGAECYLPLIPFDIF